MVTVFDKKILSERDFCTRLITPALERAGWEVQTQVPEEVSFIDGRVVVRGKLVIRGKSKRADFILYDKPGLPLAASALPDTASSLRSPDPNGPTAKDARGRVGAGLAPRVGQDRPANHRRAPRAFLMCRSYLAPL